MNLIFPFVACASISTVIGFIVGECFGHARANCEWHRALDELCGKRQKTAPDADKLNALKSHGNGVKR